VLSPDGSTLGPTEAAIKAPHRYGRGASGGPRQQRGAPGLKGPPRPLRTRARATPSPLSPLGLGPLPRAPLRGPFLPPQRLPRRASAWASPRLVTGAASASSPGCSGGGASGTSPPPGTPGEGGAAGGRRAAERSPSPSGVRPTRGRTQATCTRGPRSCRDLCRHRRGCRRWLPQGGQSAAPGLSRARPRWRGDGCRPAWRNQIR